MNILKYLIIFSLYSFVSYADQNDKRLDRLFRLLALSDDANEINEATSSIWKIWLEINDPLIENDFKMGLNSMKDGQLKESIEIFSKITVSPGLIRLGLSSFFLSKTFIGVLPIIFQPPGLSKV